MVPQLQSHETTYLGYIVRSMVPVDGVPWRQFWRLVFRPFSYTGWTTWPWTFNIFLIFQRYLMKIFRTCYTVRIFIRDGDTRSVSDIHSLPLVFHWNKEMDRSLLQTSFIQLFSPVWLFNCDTFLKSFWICLYFVSWTMVTAMDEVFN